MGIEVGLLGLIFLVLLVYAIIRTAQSSASAAAKALWIVALLVFPLLGLIAWLFFGPRG